jgi:hypothetical protein
LVYPDVVGSCVAFNGWNQAGVWVNWTRGYANMLGYACVVPVEEKNIARLYLCDRNNHVFAVSP